MAHNENHIQQAPVIPLDDWKLLGNAATNASVNFLGTTDNQPMVVRTNNELTAVFVNNSGDFTPSIIVGNNANLNTYLTNPASKSYIDGSSSGYVTLNQNNQVWTVRTGSGALGFRLNRAGGTFDAPTYISNGMQLGELSWFAYDGDLVDATRVARWNVVASASHTLGSLPVSAYLEIARSGAVVSQVMRFSGDNAGVGFNNTPVTT